jgi:hypothetical protein
MIATIPTLTLAAPSVTSSLLESTGDAGPNFADKSADLMQIVVMHQVVICALKGNAVPRHMIPSRMTASHRFPAIRIRIARRQWI